ncbi:MAG: nuclear transport factor 2 family protein [Actinobacteria bacterium]|nr:nuclear transport factor 2 family protein [Actinomycetota bacterium]
MGDIMESRTGDEVLDHLGRRLSCEDLENRYCRGVDRQDWALVRSCYHPDAVDNHGAYCGGVDGLIQWLASRHGQISRSLHYVTNILVDVLDHGALLVEAYNMTFQRFKPGIVRSDMVEDKAVPHIPKGQVLETEVRCRFIDRVEQRAGEWRIASRAVVYESFKASFILEADSFPAEAAVGKRDGTDPLYRAGAIRSDQGPS